MLHIDKHDWRFTPDDNARGYIQPQSLEELWFHTGTICNLRCPFCPEGSKPGDARIEQITHAEATPFLEEAVSLGSEGTIAPELDVSLNRVLWYRRHK